mmetsp:Transcript_19891/g.22135  ORF Transcript_19891/g.22135 Transcript_19891/m.22135 type:complete len:504 (-) Transcript_19891:86-1597(-)
MGRKGKKQNRNYITYSEWVNEFGGKKDVKEQKIQLLPYDHCALTLQPWQDPVCNPDGIIFDIVAIVPWLQKYKKDPTSGKKMKMGDLVKLHFSTNAQGENHCPMTFKVFTKSTHIVAIKTTGNVYSYEAVLTLNIKTKNYKDLLTEKPFEKSDIIHLQDPKNTVARNASHFWHIKNHQAPVKDKRTNITKTRLTEKVFREMAKMDEEKMAQTDREKLGEHVVPSKEIQNKYASAGFTSSAFDARHLKKDIIHAKKTSKKGYAQLITNFGALNFKLHCDITPLACENFLVHCENKYYKDTKFHRSIKYFMIQGGDPTGTGKGGESIWKIPFKDEFKVEKLSHHKRGLICMANSGENTNKSQFYITFKSCKHLNRKHTIFGELVGGMEVLNKMEAVITDVDDRPVKDITIVDTKVFVNPFTKEELDKEKAEKEELENPTVQTKEIGTWYSNPSPSINSSGSGVGKYMAKAGTKKRGNKRKVDFGSVSGAATKKKKNKGTPNWSSF